MLFDFTGVLTSSPFDGLAAYEREAGFAPGQLADLLLGDYASDGDHPWHRLERGEVAFADYVTEFVRSTTEAGLAVDFAALLKRFADFTVHHEVVEAARRLRQQGVRTALVTNNVREFAHRWRDLLAVDELFDQVVESWAVGMRKPDTRIYLLALDRLGGVAPEQAVMLDDAVGNVAGARAAGLHAIHVRDPAVALAELDALLARTWTC